MSQVIKLNVGGTIFHTTRSTLTRFDAFFAILLDTRVPVTRDDSGCIFIERDPKHFQLILNFMRDGRVNLPENGTEIKQIEEEATYYMLNDLSELCRQEHDKWAAEPSSGTEEVFKFLNTDADEFQAILNSKKPVVIVKIERLYFLRDNSNVWKMFIDRNAEKWSIYFSKFLSETIEYQQKTPILNPGESTVMEKML